MNPSTNQPMNLQKIASTLKTLRRKHKVSLNALSKLSGISRRTLTRLESLHELPVTSHQSRSFSPLTVMRLLRLFLPKEQLNAVLADSTKLSRGYAAQLGGHPDDYRLLDLLPDLYPYFLFHPPQNQLDVFIRKEYAPDYRSSLHQLVIRPPRNLGLRLRAFRLRHDLTLVQTADLLGLSKSELHRIERNQRNPSAPTSFRILRLLTAPVSLGPAQEVSRAKSRDSRHHFLEHLRLLTAPSPAQVGEDLACTEPSRSAPSRFESSDHAASQPEPLYPESPLVGTKGSLEADNNDPVELLRRLWLSGPLKTRDLAATLGISPPHLIRLLRGDRMPSKKLLDRISRLPP